MTASPNGSAQGHYNAGKSLCQDGHYASALSELTAAAAITPNSAAVHFWTGKAHMGLHNTAAAIASFQQSTRLDPTNAKPHLEIGRAYVIADQLGAATASFRHAERLSPHSAEPLREVAAVLIQQSQYDAALEELQRALKIEPNSGATYVLLGRAYDLKGMRQQSEQAYRQGQHLDPRFYAQAQVANGGQMENEGRLGEAVKQYREATRTDPTYLDGFLKLGGACLGINHGLEAVKAFRSATRVDPNSYIAHFMLGWVLLERSQTHIKVTLFHGRAIPPDEAMQALRRAVELSPHLAAPRCALGRAYKAAGVRHLAHEHLEMALSLDPNGADGASAREALKTL